MTDLEFIKQYKYHLNPSEVVSLATTLGRITYRGNNPIIQMRCYYISEQKRIEEIEKLLFLKNKKMYMLENPVLKGFYTKYYIYTTRQDVEIFLEILEIVVKSNIGYYYENEHVKPCSKKAFIDLCCQNLL